MPNRGRAAALAAVLAVAMAAVAAAVLPGYVTQVRERWAEEERARQAEAEQRHVEECYAKVNFAVRNWSGHPHVDATEYIPLPDPAGRNRFGIEVPTYLMLKLYEADTGVSLPYGVVADFMSEEFEPDGSLRLYDNGLHPEMEAFVDWAWDQRLQQLESGRASFSLWFIRYEEYEFRLHQIYRMYFHEHRDEGFENDWFLGLSPQMIDELARKDADPGYEMDLLGLQRQGY